MDKYIILSHLDILVVSKDTTHHRLLHAYIKYIHCIPACICIEKFVNQAS